MERFVRKKDRPSKVSLICADFIQNTSLLGIQHFLSKKSIVWLVAYMLCVGMSVMQSWSVTMKYFQHQTYQTSALLSKNRLPFPSVTVCTGTVVREGFDYSLVPGYQTSLPEEIKDCSNSKQKKDWLRVDTENRKALLAYLRRLTNAQRKALGVEIDYRVMKKCTFGKERCNFSNSEDFHFFNHPMFGNCFTFNPAFEEDNAKEANVQTGLEMDVYPKPRGFQWSHKGYIFLIHAPGTAPFMESAEVIEMLKGEIITVELDLVEMTSLKIRSGMVTCIESTDETFRKRSRYFNTESPYRYSLEAHEYGVESYSAEHTVLTHFIKACIASCTQDHAGRECGTIYKYLPVQTPEYEFNKTVKGCQVEYPIDMESCNCPIACKRIAYKISKRIEGQRRLPCASGNKGKGKESGNAEIAVKFRSNIYEKIEEQLCYSLADYLGVLGGNISLWIGLCIISLLELVELVIKLVAGVILPSNKFAAETIQPTHKFTTGAIRPAHKHAAETIRPTHKYAVETIRPTHKFAAGAIRPSHKFATHVQRPTRIMEPHQISSRLPYNLYYR